MNFCKSIMFSVIALILANNVQADEKAINVSSKIKNEIGSSAVNNIENAERMFCYQVEKKPQNFTGYTINNMAITGFCGVIDENLKQMLSEQLFMNEENIDFINTDNCTIQPKIMLRYVRGIDNTDVLLSAPCYSMSVFYAGKVQTFNMKPATELLTTIVNAFEANRAQFISPALLNQLLPIGVVQTSEHRALLNPQAQPKRNWNTSDQNTNKPKTSGWNTLGRR